MQDLQPQSFWMLKFLVCAAENAVRSDGLCHPRIRRRAAHGAANKSVDQGAFADVGAAEDGDFGHETTPAVIVVVAAVRVLHAPLTCWNRGVFVCGPEEIGVDVGRAAAGRRGKEDGRILESRGRGRGRGDMKRRERKRRRARGRAKQPSGGDDGGWPENARQ